MDASIDRDGPRYTVRFERRLAHSPKKVWRVLTEPELMKNWFPSDVVGGWAKGAKLRFVFEEGEGEGIEDADLQGEVLSVEPFRLLEYRWGANVLRYELTADGDGCRLVFSESFEDGSIAARNAAGWEMCLANLEAILQDDAPAKFTLDAWRVPFRHYVAEFEPLAGSQQGPPETHPAVMAEKAETPQQTKEGG